MSIKSVCAKWINGQMRGDSCKNVGWRGSSESGLRRRSLGDDIEEAATNKRVYMSGEGAVMRGEYNISVDIEVPRGA